MNIRKLLRILHRDFGYFVVGITFIYTVSGIALNHRTDWNPHYILVSEDLTLPSTSQTEYTKDEITAMLKKFSYDAAYRKHFITRNNEVKIFVEGGTVMYNPEQGKVELEVLKKRPFFFEINKIHLAQTGQLWIWISDIMAVLMLFVAISGLFILKGKYGMKGRGLWLTALGIVVPLAFILFFID
jgi:hypothetical protein